MTPFDGDPVFDEQSKFFKDEKGDLLRVRTNITNDGKFITIYTSIAMWKNGAWSWYEAIIDPDSDRIP